MSRAMYLTPTQIQLLDSVRKAVAGQATKIFDYSTEYLGFLPFGLYHWIEVNSEAIDPSVLPFHFSRTDLDALECAGMLRKIHQWTSTDDELHSKTTYEILKP